jgi:hypothetical protein
MKRVFANTRFGLQMRESLRLSEVIPFWFAVSSPLIGLALGVFGAWLVAWVTS